MPDEPPSLSTEGKKDISESQRRSAFRAKKSRNKSTKMGEGKPRVLILGGSGFIGRHLVHYLVSKSLTSFIRVADKRMPAISYMDEACSKAFASKEVEFKQADLTRDNHIEKVFKSDSPFDYVINLCGETKCGGDVAEYEAKCVVVAGKAGRAAASERNVRKFVEVSSASVYKPDDRPSNEHAKIDPWTLQATYRLKAEEVLKHVDGLPLVILRPSLVYGRGDLTSLTPRITCAATYKLRKEKMKLLWNEKLKMNCVHVDDVVRAIWVAATSLREGSVYNLSDSSALDQGKMNKFLANLFKIKTGFLGKLISNMAKMGLGAVADTANDKHCPSWQTLCGDYNILNTPISPFIDKELLYNNHLSIDGSQITRDSTFSYSHPKITEELLVGQIKGFIDQKLFPPLL